VYQGNSGDPNMPVEWKPRDNIRVLSRILILGGEWWWAWVQWA